MKNYGDIDSKFRFVILASMRAKQLLRGAKPRIKAKSKNLIKIAQEEVRRGLVDYEIIQAAKEEKAESEEGASTGEKREEEKEEEKQKEQEKKSEGEKPPAKKSQKKQKSD